MNSVMLWQAILCFFLFNVTAQNDGLPVVWSQPQEITLIGFKSKTNARIKTATATPKNFPSSDAYQLDLITCEALNQARLAPKAEKYFELNGKIAGLYKYGSEVIFDWGNIREPNSEKLKTRLAEINIDPRISGNWLKDSVRYDLTRIFGLETFTTLKNDSRPIPNFFKVIDVGFRTGELTVYLTSALNAPLALNFNEKLELVSAFKDNQKIHLIRSGKIPSPLSRWSGPVAHPIVNLDGQVTIQSCGAVLPSPRQDFQATAVWSRDGRIWIGDAGCKLALVKEEIVGFKMSRKGQLLVQSSNLNLERNDGSVRLFEDLLQKFQESIHNGILPEARELELTALEPGDPDLLVRSIRFERENLAVIIRTNDPRSDLKVLLNPALELLSAEKLLE
jgi:hypothetical protein